MTDRVDGARPCDIGAQHVQGPNVGHRVWERSAVQQRCRRMAERLSGPQQRLIGTAHVEDRLEIEAERTHGRERMLHVLPSEPRTGRVEVGVIARSHGGPVEHRVGSACNHAHIVADLQPR